MTLGKALNFSLSASLVKYEDKPYPSQSMTLKFKVRNSDRHCPGPGTGWCSIHSCSSSPAKAPGRAGAFSGLRGSVAHTLPAGEESERLQGGAGCAFGSSPSLHQGLLPSSLVSYQRHKDRSHMAGHNFPYTSISWMRFHIVNSPTGRSSRSLLL